MDSQTNSISFISILKVVAVLVGAYFLYFIRDLLFILFLAIILASLIKPVALWFKQHKMPVGLGVVFVYLILIGSFVGVLFILLPSLIEETKGLMSVLSNYLKSAGEGFDKLKNQSDVFLELANKLKPLATSGEPSALLGQVLETVRGLLGGIVSMILVLVIAFYLVIEEDGIKKMARGVIPPQY